MEHYFKSLLMTCVVIGIFAMCSESQAGSVGGGENLPEPFEPNKPISFLKAVGTVLCNEEGDTIQLKGTNFGSYLSFEQWMSPCGYGPLNRETWEVKASSANAGNSEVFLLDRDLNTYWLPQKGENGEQWFELALAGNEVFNYIRLNIKQFNPICQKNNSNKLKLIYVGSVTYRKGIHRLLHVVYNMDGVEIFLAGTYDKHSKIYKNYCKYSHIHFVGFVTRDRLNELYNSCDVFVLPSFCEGMAMVGLEAMATGLPIICTRYTGVNDVVRDGINGFVYDANDEKALRVCIEWFLKNKSHLKEMSLNARNSVLDYSWEHYHERVAKTIRECIISKKEDKA